MAVPIMAVREGVVVRRVAGSLRMVMDRIDLPLMRQRLDGQGPSLAH
jgi:hypothetical protein